MTMKVELGSGGKRHEKTRLIIVASNRHRNGTSYFEKRWCQYVT